MNKRGVILIVLSVISLTIISAGFFAPNFIDMNGNVVSEPLKGDVNGDGSVDPYDVDYLKEFLFSEGPSPNPLSLGDVDLSGGIDIGDFTALTIIVYSGKRCYEWDGGQDHYVKGEIRYFYQGDGNEHSAVDECSGDYVQEYSCDFYDSVKKGEPLQSYMCPNGCNDGKCILGWNNAYTTKLISIGSDSATIQITDGNDNSISKEVSKGGSKNINGITVLLNNIDLEKNAVEVSFRLALSYTESPAKWLNFNNPYYRIGLLSSSDSASTISVAELSSGSQETKEITEGTSKFVDGLNVKVLSSYENQFDLVSEIEVGPLLLGTEGKLTCFDSDGGKNYQVKGVTQDIDSNTSFEDKCSTDIQTGQENLKEYYCSYRNVESVNFNCPNGCTNGACNALPVLDTCSDFITGTAFPSDFNVGDITFYNGYSSSYNTLYSINGVNEKAKSYYSSWNAWKDKAYYYDLEVMVFDNKNINLSSFLDEFTKYNICVQSTIWSNNNAENKVYICNWNVLEQSQDIEGFNTHFKNVMWYNGNVMVLAYVGIGERLTDEEIQTIVAERANKFFNDLQDNRQKFIGWEYFALEDPFNELFYNTLDKCGSQIPEETCSSNWYCTTEPAVCPPHGYQTQKCIDYSCGKEKMQTISCTPGLCAGCMVPKWFGDRWSSNKCIPYGFRFEQQTGDYIEKIYSDNFSETLTSQNTDDASLVVESSERAVLTFYGKDQNFTYILTPGAEVVLKTPEFESYIEFKLIVNSINYNPDGESSVDVRVIASYLGKTYLDMNAYCDIDGVVKRQKTKDLGGNWASCQNNYECESNVCSSGECIEVRQLLQEASGFKKSIVKVACRVLHPISDENYDNCVLDLLGQTPSTGDNSTDGSGGGAGGGGSP